MAYEEKVIEYVSSEIESQLEHMTTWRSRASLSVFLGPYVILGSILIGTKGLAISVTGNLCLFILSVLGLAVCFIGLGFASASVEEHCWDYCNKLRTLVAKLQRGEITKLGDDDLVFPHRVKTTYIYTYILLIISFVFTVVIISQLGQN